MYTAYIVHSTYQHNIVYIQYMMHTKLVVEKVGLAAGIHTSLSSHRVLERDNNEFIFRRTEYNADNLFSVTDYLS